MLDSVIIRPAQSPAEYVALQEAQRAAWGITDEHYVVPVATMVGMNLHGGLVLGAFADTGRAVGLSIAFLGKVDGVICLYSQLTGVVPDLQDAGIGTRLKLAQRDFALREGLSAIAWAFDPWKPGNARFNLNKLGAHAIRYYENMYGQRTDQLNADSPTDRLLAWWPVNTAPRRRHNAADVARLPLVPPEGTVDWPFPAARIEIAPHDQTGNPSQRREQVRRAFSAAFERGWRATDFVRLGAADEARYAYVVEP